MHCAHPPAGPACQFRAGGGAAGGARRPHLHGRQAHKLCPAELRPVTDARDGCNDRSESPQALLTSHTPPRVCTLTRVCGCALAQTELLTDSPPSLAPLRPAIACSWASTFCVADARRCWEPTRAQAPQAQAARHGSPGRLFCWMVRSSLHARSARPLTPRALPGMARARPARSCRWTMAVRRPLHSPLCEVPRHATHATRRAALQSSRPASETSFPFGARARVRACGASSGGSCPPWKAGINSRLVPAHAAGSTACRAPCWT